MEALNLFRRVIHTVGPKYAVKYHTAAENALSHCYRSCLELLIEHRLQRSYQSSGYIFPVLNFQSFYWIHLNWKSFAWICEKCSIAMGCIYTDAKNYPREPAAHVAISKVFCSACYKFGLWELLFSLNFGPCLVWIKYNCLYCQTMFNNLHAFITKLVFNMQILCSHWCMVLYFSARMLFYILSRDG